MPQNNAGAVVDRLRKALDAQGRSQQAAKDAAAANARQPETPPAESPQPERKR